MAGRAQTSRVIRTTPAGLRRRMLAAIKPVASERIAIEKSRGRILAEPVRASHPHPEMDRSAMDGYAVRFADIRRVTKSHPVELHEVGNIPAGRRLRRRLRPGDAVRIMTGAPLPPGADTVVPIELVSVADGQVHLATPTVRHKHVRRKGTEIKRHETVLRTGQVIGPAEMATLALLDRPRVRVFRRPRVGILSTGDELGAVGRKRPYGHIPDSNRYGLMGLVESAGCVPVDGGRASDAPEDLLSTLKALRRKSDFILTTGGVSAGDCDVVKVLFAQIGGVDLYRLPIKPGKPQAFGHVGGVPYFGLPGNPVSSMVVFDFVVRPVLRRLAGAARIDLPGWKVRVEADFPQKSRQWEFPRATAREIDGYWTVKPAATQGSANLKSMVRADGYLVLGPDTPPPVRGAEVLFVPLPC